MGKGWRLSRARVLCPYYKDENACLIRCIGVEDGCVTHVAFADRGAKKDYRAKYCVSDHCRCPMKRMLDGIYDN